MIASRIAAYLHDLGLVDYRPAGVGGDAFIDTMPQTPDAAVGIFNTGGNLPDAKLGYDEPTFQVRVRAGADPRVATARLMSVYAALHGLSSVQLGDIHVVSVEAVQSGPVPLGQDGNSRHTFVCNFASEVRSLTGHRV